MGIDKYDSCIDYLTLTDWQHYATIVIRIKY